jgi:hypothetical protein
MPTTLALVTVRRANAVDKNRLESFRLHGGRRAVNSAIGNSVFDAMAWRDVARLAACESNRTTPCAWNSFTPRPAAGVEKVGVRFGLTLSAVGGTTLLAAVAARGRAFGFWTELIMQ